ncbi:MAG: hypothetical protein JO069_09775 [Verrucomicrobia bacterium]|nr:hypothetical protein [Verrucomicrobiota bacterium]
MQARLIDGGNGRARTYAVIFGKGDEIMSGMTALAQREHLADSHFTAIGAIQSGLMGWFDRDRKAYKNIPVESQAEVASLIGDIGLVSGKPSVYGNAGRHDEGRPLAARHRLADARTLPVRIIGSAE